ncbi:DUF6078 family protein [uncultured Parabacteroides sp.]|uniref:DUF6078 family protein n=1 Tax=uncultured Parabacteroides sp. TaxID=512312 RepID=UPI0025CED0A0|nr:DUF6078 family protein [uncultured Parabacteroides sp.]
MENDFDYKLVPYDFAHCFNTQCPKAGSCLRSLAGEESKSGDRFITIVNPAYYPSGEDECPFFKPCQKVRMAWGISHLLDNVPLKEATGLRQQMIAHFNKSLYYRFYRKEYALSPRDQHFIRQLFKQRGIVGEPVFDSYTEAFDW